MNTHHSLVGQMGSMRKTLLGGMAMTVAAGLLLLPSMASGATLLLDFGSSTAYDGVNSPAHVDGTVPLTNTDWQAVSDLNAQTVQDSAGDNIFIDLGRNQNTNAPYDKIDLDAAVAAGSYGTGTGIFATGLTNDYFISHPTANRDPIAALISGLPLGQYYVYVVGHYGGNANASLNVLAGAAPSTLVADGLGLGVTSHEIDSVYDLATSAALSGGNTEAWVEGVNYGKFTVTLTNDNSKLLVAVDQVKDAGPAYSYLTAVMITPVPEPGTIGLLAGAGLLMLRRRKN